MFCLVPAFSNINFSNQVMAIYTQRVLLFFCLKGNLLAMAYGQSRVEIAQSQLLVYSVLWPRALLPPFAISYCVAYSASLKPCVNEHEHRSHVTATTVAICMYLYNQIRQYKRTQSGPALATCKQRMMLGGVGKVLCLVLLLAGTQMRCCSAAGERDCKNI